MRDQSGVISRSQALELGLDVVDVKRLLRRREWTTVHPGVYVDHTGPLTWDQRAWAAVLHAWPAALSHESALRPGRGPIIHVVVDSSRKVVAPTGVVIHGVRGLERDLDAALDRQATVRLGWGQVFERPCSTATKIARLLDVAVAPCPDCVSAGSRRSGPR